MDLQPTAGCGRSAESPVMTQGLAFCTALLPALCMVQQSRDKSKLRYNGPHSSIFAHQNYTTYSETSISKENPLPYELLHQLRQSMGPFSRHPHLWTGAHNSELCRLQWNKGGTPRWCLDPLWTTYLWEGEVRSRVDRPSSLGEGPSPSTNYPFLHPRTQKYTQCVYVTWKCCRHVRDIGW